MLSIGATTRIFFAVGATDMRKGFDGLQGLVLNVLKQDPLTGHLFLFVNRRRDRLKILYWDGDGLAICVSAAQNKGRLATTSQR